MFRRRDNRGSRDSHETSTRIEEAQQVFGFPISIGSRNGHKRRVSGAQRTNCGLHDVSVRHLERGGLGEDRDVPVVRRYRADVEDLVQIVEPPIFRRECVEARLSAVIRLFFEPSLQLFDENLALLVSPFERFLPVQPRRSEWFLPYNGISRPSTSERASYSFAGPSSSMDPSRCTRGKVDTKRARRPSLTPRARSSAFLWAERRSWRCRALRFHPIVRSPSWRPAPLREGSPRLRSDGGGEDFANPLSRFSSGPPIVCCRR